MINLLLVTPGRAGGWWELVWRRKRDAWRVSAAVTMGRDRLSNVCVNLYSPLFSRSIRILLQLSGKLASEGNGGR